MWAKISGAIRDSDAKLLRFYLDQEPGLVYELNNNEETLLHHAARNADSETILELLSRGARADSSDDFDWSPMHEACRSNNEAAVAIFIATGIDLNMKTAKKDTPLHIAARHNAFSIMARLLAAGADKEATNKNGNTALHLAAQKGFIPAVDVLITAGANLRARNEIGLTPLHMTAIKGHFRCADILLSHGANPLQLDDTGKTFLEVAETCRNYFFKIQAKSRIDELAEESRQTTSDEADAIVNKAKLSDFFNDKVTNSESKTKSNCSKIVSSLVAGENTHSSVLGKITEHALWFAVFPMLLFLLWKGFATGTLPSIINLNLNIGSLADAASVNALFNMLIVFFVSHLLITTEQESLSALHFFKDIRETVHFRVTHLLLIEVFYASKLVMDQSFFTELAVFWVWFMILYVASYLVWWSNTHAETPKRSDNATEICYAHD